MKKNILLVLVISTILIAIYLILIRKAEKSNQPLSLIENKEEQNNYTQDIELLIYTSKNFQYKIKYSKSLGFIEHNDGKNVYFSLTKREKNIQKDFDVTITFFSYYDKEVSIKDWWEEYGPQNERQAPYPDEEKEIKIGNLDAYYTSYETSRTSFGYEYFTPVFIYIIHDSKVFEISGVKLPSDAKDLGFSDQEIQEAKVYESIFNQMLQSFTFTK